MSREIVRQFAMDASATAGSHLHLDEMLTGTTRFDLAYRPAGPLKVGGEVFNVQESVTLELGALRWTVTPELWDKINIEMQGLIAHGRKVTKSASGSDVAKQVGL